MATGDHPWSAWQGIAYFWHRVGCCEMIDDELKVKGCISFVLKQLKLSPADEDRLDFDRPVGQTDPDRFDSQFPCGKEGGVVVVFDKDLFEEQSVSKREIKASDPDGRTEFFGEIIGSHLHGKGLDPCVTQHQVEGHDQGYQDRQEIEPYFSCCFYVNFVYCITMT